MASLVRKMMIKHCILGVPYFQTIPSDTVIVCVKETDPPSLEEAHFES